MHKYAKIYQILTSQEIQSQLIYKPLMAVFSFIAHFSWVILSFVFLSVVSAQTLGHTQLELMLFLSYFHSVKGFFWIVCSQNSAFLAGRGFREGRIDFLILKPLHSQWFVSTLKPNIFAITDLTVGIGSFIYFAILLRLFNMGFLLYFILFILISALILYSVWFSYMSLFVTSGEASAVHGLLNSFWVFGEYPNAIYEGLSKFIATIVFPTFVITTLPMSFLLQQNFNLNILIFILFAPVSLLVSHLLWTRMLRLYTSAN